MLKRNQHELGVVEGQTDYSRSQGREPRLRKWVRGHFFGRRHDCVGFLRDKKKEQARWTEEEEGVPTGRSPWS